MITHAPQDAETILAEARSGATWRGDLGLPEPSTRLSQAISALGQVVATAARIGGLPTFDSVLSAVSQDRSGESEVETLVRRVLRAMFEERRTPNPV